MAHKLALRSVYSALLGTAAVSVALQAVPAMAQADQNGVEEIVVTAERRAENIEKVPMSVTALNANALEQRNITSEADLQTAVPGLVVLDTAGQNNYTLVIRGQSVDAYSNSPPAVLTYYDDVNVSPHAQTTFYDMQDIQVLKGPQGTLFGRNTTGGAVLYQTAQPTDQWEGYLLADEGSYATSKIQGAINIPIDPKVEVRLAANYSDGGAFVYNLNSHDWWGGSLDNAERATVTLKPITGLTSTTMIQYDFSAGLSVPFEMGSVYKCGTPGLNTTADCDTGGIAYADLQAQNARGPYVSDSFTRETYKATSDLLVNTTQYQLDENTVLKNIFGGGRTYSNGVYEYVASSVPLNNNTAAGENFITDEFSEEAQIQGSLFDDHLTYTGGFYTSYQKFVLQAPLLFLNLYPSDYNAASTERTNAGYAQATYKLDDKWSVTGGFRYTWDTNKLKQLALSGFGPGHPESVSIERPSYVGSVNYQFTPDVMFYVTTRGSYRSGGLNDIANPLDTTAAGNGNLFLPEGVKDVEGGVKATGEFAGMPFRANLDGYNTWITNVQRVDYVVYHSAPEGLTVNAPAAQITGAEGDFDVKPMDWLMVGGAFAYTDARFTSANVTIFGEKATFGPFADAPGWSGSLFGQVSREMPGDIGTLFFRVDTFLQSKYYYSNFNATTNPDSVIPGYGLVNLRLSLQDVLGSQLTPALEVSNLLNQTHYDGGLSQGSDLGANSIIPGRPRIIMGELRYDF